MGEIKSKVEINTPPPIPDLEKPILEVSITNPFKKILYWLDQVRRKQTTTFAIKLSIPLIAFPVIAFAFYSLGRSSSLISPAPITPSPIIEEPVGELSISKAGILKIARGKENRYLLNLKDGKVIVLTIPIGADLTKFQNKQVLVTGPYNRNTSVMKVEDIAEIELLTETSEVLVTPTPTITPTTIPTLIPTSSPTPTNTPSATPTQ